MGASSQPEGKFIFLFRTALFVGLGSVVATIIYLTPIPDQFPQSCRRRCHELDWPMICRIKMKVDQIPCHNSDCPASGLAVNHRELGPPIQVCENDIVMVDVTNRVAGRSLTVHWRGQTLKETPHMDGVAMITQCPIIPHTTFQYKFRASDAGTHFWQFHPAGLNLFGAFIVKQSANRDVHRKLFDTDDVNHVIAVQIQGKKIVMSSAEQVFLSPASFNVTAGVRHRFRLLFGGAPNLCRIRFYVSSLPVTLLALDGHATKASQFSGIEFGFGERVDFVLQVLDQDSVVFEVEPEMNCDGVLGSSAHVLVLPSSQNVVNSLPDSSFALLKTLVDKDCGLEKVACLTDIENAQKLPQQLTESRLNHKIFLFFGVRPLSRETNATIITTMGSNAWGAPHINNKTMILPSSPIMSQSEDINRNIFCDLPCAENTPCECVHVLHVPLLDTVEIILAHQGEGRPRNSFHLHGNSFYVVGATQLDSSMHVDEIMTLDIDEKLVKRNFHNPVKKDSVSVPERGVVVLRLIASNPGYWLLDEELSLGGMQVLLHVGEDNDLPRTPNNFPKCGSWVGPEFFLA